MSGLTARRAFGILILATAAVASGCQTDTNPADPQDVPPSAATQPESDTDLASVDSSVLWFADHASGDVSQWDGVSISGDAEVQIVTSPTRSGGYALKLINWNVDGSHSPGVRMRVQRLGADPENLPTDAYYSAWYFVPFPIEGRDNVFQFKQADVDEWDDEGNPVHQTRRMLSKISMDWDGSAYDLEYRTRIDQSTGAWRDGPADALFTADTNIPVGRWFHLEMRYVWNDRGRGRSTLWVNGSQVWDLTGIYTEANNLVYMQEPRQWAVNHYLSDEQGYVAPGDSWIFVDDAVISLSRVGVDDSLSGIP